MSNSKETLNVYRSSKLFTYLCARDDTLYGFRFSKNKLTIITTEGNHEVKMLQAASEYDDSLYVKFKGIIYRYDSRYRDTPWSSVCYAS